MENNLKNTDTPTPEKSEDKKSAKPSPRKLASIIGFSVIGLAALALIVTILITYISSNNKISDAKVSPFSSESQIVTKLKSVIKSSNKFYSSDANYLKGITDTPSATIEPADEDQKNKQEQNSFSGSRQSSSETDADTVKTDDKYIYFLSSGINNRISVFSAEGENSKLISEISVSSKETETVVFKDFFVTGKKLIAIEEAKINISSTIARTYTRVEFFDISDIKKIKSADIFTQSGNYSESKTMDGKLYLASTHHASGEKDLPCAVYGDKVISTSDDDNPDRIPAKDIYCVDNPNEANFAVISEIDTDSSAEPTSIKAVLGSSGGVYCGEKHFYITAYEYNENLFNKQNVDGSSFTHLPVNRTQVVKVDLKNNLDFSSSVSICGYIDDSYSFDEKDDCLRVVTTTTLDNDKFTEAANIFVLDKDLKCVGKITDFASNESIQTVRYINDTAYVITYKAADPLFIIDLTKNSEPKVLGETKISGFSSTLVPVDDNTLLSVGYYTAKEDSVDSDGIKLTTFDVSKKNKPKKLDEMIFKNYESPVQYDQNTLLINTERNDYAIPMIYGSYNESESSYETKFGVLNFMVEDGKINIVQNHTSEIFKNSEDSAATVDRCIYIGDYMYLLGSDVNYYNTDGTALIEAVKYK